MPGSEIIIDRSWTSTGMGLHRDGNILFVVSSCCGYYVDSMFKPKGWGYGDDYAMRCQNCCELVGHNPNGWKSVLRAIDEYNGSTNVEGYWTEWGEFFFGWKEFEMRIDNE